MTNSSKVTSGEIMAQIRKQAFLCGLSGRTLTPDNASIDHIHPLGRGGSHELANIWIVDQQVNTAKGTLTLDDFVSLCRDVARYQDAIEAEANGDV